MPAARANGAKAAPAPTEPVTPPPAVEAEAPAPAEAPTDEEPAHAEEPEIVAVGTVSHVIRRAFHQFYPEANHHEATTGTGIESKVEETTRTDAAGVVSPPSDEATSTESGDAASTQQVAVVVNPYVALGESRKQLIQDALALKHSTAGQLMAFLDERYSDANTKDEAIAADLASQGLIIKAQIPMGPSNLKLSLEELQAFGVFGTTLVHAKELVKSYHRDRLDKSGNGPAFLARKVAGIKHEPPGYLNTTSSSTIRKETTFTTHEYHIQTVKAAETSKRQSAVAAVIAETVGDPTTTGNDDDSASTSKSVRFGASASQMPAPERRKNMAILERMQTKLDFLRNPRYAPTPHQEDDQVATQPSFVAVPSPVEFTDYDTGGVYEQSFYLRNTSQLSRRVRVLPPGSIYFSVDEIVFPDASGLVAPGMHVEVKLRFAPDSRADYKDVMTIQYEGSSAGQPAQFSLPILAHRTPPELSIPLLLRAQHTLVGSQTLTRIPCKNTGGKARFWIMTEQDWHRCESTTAFRAGAIGSIIAEFLTKGGLNAGPFTLSPNEMELDTGESLTLELLFLPSAIGELREKFVMVCDNCLVRVFQLVGRGCQVELSITDVNTQPVDTSVAFMGRVSQLGFPQELLLQATATQSFTVQNDTPIDLKFTWKLETRGDEASTQMQPCPYRVEPALGVLKQSDSAAFTVAFSPVSAKRFSQWRLVLYINDIPACSMPGPDQLTRLTETFQRLRDLQYQQQRNGSPTKRLMLTAEPKVKSMSVALSGAGKLGSFHLEPSAVRIVQQETRELQLGEAYTTATRVVNDCDAHVTVHWDLARARLVGSTGVSDSMHKFDLTVNYVDMTIAPLAHIDAELTFTPLAVGSFSLSVPCTIRDPFSCSSVERWLLIEGVVGEPKLRISQQEIDFGLVLVSAKTETVLAIRNDSRVAAADWLLTHLEAAVPVDPIIPPQTDDARTEQFSPRGPKEGLRRVGSKDSISSRHSAASSSVQSSGNRTNRSSTGSLAMFTTRDLAPRAAITFQPPTGRLAPGETMKITVTCQAGSLPERFRGTFALKALTSTLPPSFTSRSTPQSVSVSARGEIQSPNVFLTPLKLALGTTYLGVRVERTLQLVNVSNLEANFKFMEPQGASKATSIEFSPQQGVLRSKETLSIRLSYTPRQAGKTTTLLACSVQGLSGPLGFEVVSNHKGLVLTYDVLSVSEALPLAPIDVAKVRGINVSDGEFEPDVNPLNSLPKLLFGDEIPLTERRSLQLVIRNFSGIDANVELEPKRYAAAPLVDSATSNGSHESSLSSKSSRSGVRLASRTSKSSSSLSHSHSTASGTGSSPKSSKTARKKLLLTDEHEPKQRFQSDKGRDYMQGQEHTQQDRALLGEGRGVAFLVTSASPVANPTGSNQTQSHALEPVRTLSIAPWQQAVVYVTCFNNMPGVFTDALVSRAVGLPPVFMPIQATVVGTPLVLDRNCVGLHFPRPRQPQQPLKPTFSFGHICVRSPVITKTLRVMNRGPRAAKLKWKLVENGKENQLVQVSLRVDFAARVRLRITPVADSDDVDFPFEITPTHALVQPFSTSSFNVKFSPSMTPLAPRVLLVADALWIESSSPLVGLDSPSSSLASLELVEGGTPVASEPADQRCETTAVAHVPTAAGKAIQAVRMANALASRGHLALPPGTSGKNAVSDSSPKCIRALLCANVVEPELFLDQPRFSQAPYHIKFTTWSTLLSAESAWSHVFHRKELSLTNHMNARVTFRLESTGPFAVTRAESLAPKHPLATSDLPPAHRRADGESFLFTLPPQMAVRIEMRLDPAKLATTLADTVASKGCDPKLKDKLKLQVDGELLVRFTNDSVQTIRLLSEILRPLVVVSPSVHCFGRVFLSRSRSVTVRVANPTAVPASFSIVHVPRPRPISRAQKQETAKHHAHFVDDASVFSFSVMRGVVRGPTVSLRSAGGAPQPAVNSIKDLLDAVDDDKRLVFAPLEIRATFQPKELGKRYKCRFRLVVDEGVDFDLVLEGEGHLDEVEHHDQDRPMVRASELTHQNLIFKRLSSS